ncbi:MULTISPECIES: hypothetical protein [Legionella]|uniref:Transmembrane protein n=2 Tax=Legionella TaxID=445 RepID=A0A0W1AC73_9GAMM|nr:MULTISPECIES: hypothetical protein [Legionella]KTD54218.1 hypothetical protein Lsai_3040 [Legionella sainthelensi]KTD78946.1 hypothetical protein Lwal_1716 [Legionella waltersii]SNV07363.1 Uncharacterised protein [Legionella waltersii]VEH29827.1 Uncharacterised protein [Legionella sainthelensi]GAN26119.1 hypothetical protein lpymg_01001 [Legionella pneumophila]
MRSLKFLIKPYLDYVFYTEGYPKLAYHFIIPLMMTLILTIFGTSDTDKLVNSGYTVLTFISAFSFAALISFSNLKSKHLSEKIWGNKLFSSVVIPVIYHCYKNGHKIKINHSRKSFISLLLGYICFTSTILLTLLVVFNSLHIPYFCIKLIGKILFFWLFFSLLVNVIYAIQYFTKINLEEALEEDTEFDK